MKKIFNTITNILLITFLAGTSTIKADEPVTRAPACQIVESYVVKSKSQYTKIDNTVPLRNSLSYTSTLTASASRTKSTSISGSISLSIIEDLLGLNAEISYNSSSSITLSASAPVPAGKTVYVEFGSLYVTTTVQKKRINSDCSTTWLGSPTTATYTYNQYINVRN